MNKSVWSPFAYIGSPLIYLIELSPKIVEGVLFFFWFTKCFSVNVGREEGKYERKGRFKFNLIVFT